MEGIVFKLGAFLVGAVVGYFGKLLFKRRDEILDLAIKIARRHFVGLPMVDVSTNKEYYYNSLYEDIIRELKLRGISKYEYTGVENAVKLAIETVVREEKPKTLKQAKSQ